MSAPAFWRAITANPFVISCGVVDHQLDPIYEKAQMGAGMSVELVYKDNTSMELPFVNIHYASLRQIAYEVLNSPALLTLAENV